MKNLFVSALVFLALSILGCQDAKDDAYSQPDVEFYKAIGTQIPLETGIRWMQTYDKTNSQGRQYQTDYVITASQLETLRQSTPLLVGIAIHHGIDTDGTHHFILIPIDATLGLWSLLPGRVYLDANTDSQISASTAHAWALNYTEANPGSIWFHFFGLNVFDEIATIPFFTTLEIVPAINDADLTPQLLLVVEDESQANNPGGRSNYQSTMIYDASSPCPPCPVAR
jgi:hypothetical protein